MFSFGQSISAFFVNYFKFSGRAQRSEFWWAYLFTSLVSVLTSLFGAIDPLASSTLTVVTGAVFFVPQISLTVRRLHDSGRSGWWYAAPLPPFAVAAVFATGGGTDAAMLAAGLLGLIGFGLLVFVLVCMFLPSNPGANRFGEPSVPPLTIVQVAPSHA